LDSLLDNRIGIRGWWPLKFNKKSNLDANVEVAIRFTRHNDIHLILDAAHQIGWKRKQFQIDNPLPIPKTKCEIKKTFEDFKFLLKIERAANLSQVYDHQSNKLINANTFCTYSIDDNSNDFIQTSSIESSDALSPVWNYEKIITINLNICELRKENFFIIINIWHNKMKHSDNILINLDNNSSIQLIGNVKVDLGSLLCGLGHITGWYNIQNYLGQCQGQLKVSVIPQNNTLNLFNDKKKSSSSSLLLFDKTEHSNELSSCIDSESKALLSQKLAELEEINQKLKGNTHFDIFISMLIKN
jgi:hypothetical protein